MIDHLSFILSSLIIQITGVTSSFIFQNSLLPWGTKLLSLSIFKITCIHLFPMSLEYCKQQGNHRTCKESKREWGREAGYYCCQPHFGPRDILSISSFVWGGVKPLGSELSPPWPSYICTSCTRARMLKLEGLRRAGQRNPAADKPRFDRFCLLSHYPTPNPFSQKQCRQLHRVCELINKPCQRWPGLYRTVLDICLYDCICQQTRKAACRQLAVAGPWGVENQFITIVTNSFSVPLL